MHHFTSHLLLQRGKEKTERNENSSATTNLTHFWMEQSGFLLSLFLSGTKQKILRAPESDGIDLRENLVA
jgi:hypothetical protein